jgi:hypothetical protein
LRQTSIDPPDLAIEQHELNAPFYDHDYQDSRYDLGSQSSVEPGGGGNGKQNSRYRSEGTDRHRGDNTTIVVKQLSVPIIVAVMILIGMFCGAHGAILTLIIL